MTHIVQNRIGGDVRDAADGATFEQRNPADRSQVVSVAPESTEADVADAVAAAADAAAAWKRTTPTQRADILTKAANALAAKAPQLAAEMTAEMGKPLADTTIESGRTPKNLALYAGEAYRLTGTTFPSDDTPLVYSVLDPVGVVGVITPWNFPLNLASRKIGPALAAGNTVVFKPSPFSPLLGNRLAEAFEEAGLPAGVLNVVHGFAAGAHLVNDARVGAVTFTGSNATGRKIHGAMSIGRRLQLELGGKNPVLVLADADVDAAADVVARSSFGGLAGQACTGAGRVLVHESLHDALVDKVVAKAAALVVGPGDRAGVTMGPLVADSARATVHAAVERAVADGATVVCGGAPYDGELEGGSFYPPTVLTGVRDGSAMSREEVFGPVIGFESFSDLDAAIASANAVEYGLSAAVCTKDIGAAQRCAAELQAGMVRINRPTVGAAFNAPFGGVKQSGTGTHKEQLGPTVMDFYTVSRTVWLGS